MNCPVCERSLAPTLSICPTCGAMMNDTVREELQTKITTGAAAVRIAAPVELAPKAEMPPPIAMAAAAPAVSVQRVQTANLSAPKTSPTLVEFQHKSPEVPDWRLQLQNAVQQRKGGQGRTAESHATPVSAVPARKAAPSPRMEEHANIADPRVANAMKRIADSRKTFLDDGSPARKTAHGVPAAPRPFGIVGNTVASAAAVAPARVAVPQTPVMPKPRLVEPQIPAIKRDTNRLPKIEILQPSQEPNVSAEEIFSGRLERPAPEFAEIKRIRITADETAAEGSEWPQTEAEEIEDLAPFSMRFGAGLFDFIIGTFASMVLLSPFAFTGTDWFTGAGLMTFTGTTAVVMFLYMTVSLGFLGKTAGMKLFTLELVDAVENEYPTLKQAAVNSSLYLLSTAFAGAGFLTVLFNEERRALHDLLSGTILVREF